MHTFLFPRLREFWKKRKRIIVAVLAAALLAGIFTLMVWRVMSRNYFRISLISCISWSSDGTQIAVGYQDNTIHVLIPSCDGTRSVRRTIRLAPEIEASSINYVFEVKWSEDGKWLVYRRGNSSTIDIVDVETGKLVHKLPGDGSFTWSPDSTRIAAAVSDSGV